MSYLMRLKILKERYFKVSETRIETVFCDDIREEVGNKRSLMGIYHGEMFVQSVPILLPRLCFYINFVSDLTVQAGKVVIKVVKGADEEELMSTGVIEPEQTVKNENHLGVPYLTRTLTLAFGLSPFMIDSETVIKVVAETDLGKIIGPCLRIRLADNQLTKAPNKVSKRKVVNKPDQ